MLSPSQAQAIDSNDARYLDFLKGVLTRTLFPEKYRALQPRRGSLKWAMLSPLQAAFSLTGLELVRKARYNPDVRAAGGDWPPDAETMVGLRALDCLQACIVDMVRRGVPGDVIETGVWRGGCSIFMRAVLDVLGEHQRISWVADSFEGLPKPDAERYPADAGDELWKYSELAVSLEQVRANFSKYGYLSDRVRFLKGWFKDTLPVAPIRQLAIMRLDGDLYESTMDALRALYPRLSPGGYVLIDDYGAMDSCAKAVEDYRAEHGITEPLTHFAPAGVYWQRR